MTKGQLFLPMGVIAIFNVEEWGTKYSKFSLSFGQQITSQFVHINHQSSLVSLTLLNKHSCEDGNPVICKNG